ncbi:oxygen-insensitive NAD(P)H nitroreductase [Paenibacillus sp. JSM ZJ436]|uniref:oxygen-insensitive NAD(P)H nitroreductase n=1 Tax=unclassified Paenibacillus TaxID=185978 RepID=UPI0024437AB6|nr:oxygen-insensitive NAD(P)H nitroreductase [Paenibacillus sp. F411]
MEAMKKRYSAKEFDPSKSISSENMRNIEALLQLAPSSTNLQPWHFIIAQTDEGKKRMARAAEGLFIFNKSKVLNAAAVVVFATKTDISEEYLQHLTDREDQDGRFAQGNFKTDNHNGRKMFVDFHKFDYKDVQQWAEKQVYLNLGSFLLGVAALDIDAVAMEGMDLQALDDEFSLHEKGFSSCVVVALGYRAPSDFNAALPKSRLDVAEIIEHV